MQYLLNVHKSFPGNGICMGVKVKYKTVLMNLNILTVLVILKVLAKEHFNTNRIWIESWIDIVMETSSSIPKRKKKTREWEILSSIRRFKKERLKTDTFFLLMTLERLID